MGSNMPALIVARAGPFRESLMAFLKVFPQVAEVTLAADMPSALRTMADHQPSIVLIDVEILDSKIAAAIEQIKAQKHPCQCLVLTDSREQQQEAMTAGADDAVPRGFASRELFEAVRRLLPPHTAPTELVTLASPS